MGTYPHLLTRQRLPALPGRIIALDCHPNVTPDLSSGWRCRHTLAVGCAVVTDYQRGQPARRSVSVFRSSAEAANIVWGAMRRRKLTWLVAHNLPYDLTLAGAFHWIESGWAELTHYTIDDPPSLLGLHDGDRCLCAVDLLNYWRKPLNEIAAHLGCTPHERSCGSSDPDWVEAVCRSHALATAIACDRLVSFLHSTLGGGWRPTAAGIAWGAYRSRVWGDRIRVHSNLEATRVERAAYAGARVRCHRIGQAPGRVTVLDINNLYGAVMHREHYPVKLRALCKPTPAELYRRLADGWCAVAAVRLRTDSPDYPRQTEGGYVYPVGTFDTVLAGPDLIPALLAGQVEDVYQCALYDAGRPFSAYVDHWYTARLEAREAGNPAGAALAKLITSSLFGKLGQRGRSWEPYTLMPPPARYCLWHERDHVTGTWHTCRAVAGVAQREIHGGEGPHSAVAVAAYVTSYARREMLHLRAVAGADQVYYEDTDSLHVSPAGYAAIVAKGLVSQTRLGALKVVGEHQSAHYWGVKAYSLDGAVTAAGLSASAHEVADGTYVQDRKVGLARLPSDGPPDGIVVEQQSYRLPRSRPN